MWNTNYHFLMLYLFSLMLICEACKIRLKIFSKTSNPFQLQVFIPAIQTKTERITFTHGGEQRFVMVEGKECNRQHWSFKTWKRIAGGDDEWIPAKEKNVKLEGDGWIDIFIDNEYMPSLKNRFNIFCSEGFCS